MQKTIQYEHFGVPVKEKRPGMLYAPEFKVWYSDYEKHEYRIEWVYFEKGSPLHPLIQSVQHVCFVVPDIEKAVRGKNVLLPPTFHHDLTFAFIETEGAVVEFFQSK